MATIGFGHPWPARVAAYRVRGNGTDLAEVESNDFILVEPDEREGASWSVLPRPGTSEVYLHIHGVAGWLWSLGDTPQNVDPPDELMNSSYLHWSPDGQRIATRGWKTNSIFLWNPSTGVAAAVTPSPPVVGAYNDVSGWTADSSAVVVYNGAHPSSCMGSPALFTVDVTDKVGASHVLTPSDGAVGYALDSGVEMSMATGVAVLYDPDQLANLTGIGPCPSEPVALAVEGTVLDLKWSLDGTRLLVLTDFDDQSVLWTYSNDFGVLSRTALPDRLLQLAAVSDDGRWLVGLDHDVAPDRCAAHVIDLGRNTSWPINPCADGFHSPSYAWLEGNG